MIREDLIDRAQDCDVLAVEIAWAARSLSREKSA
jgi:hypothetical protein